MNAAEKGWGIARNMEFNEWKKRRVGNRQSGGSEEKVRLALELWLLR